MHAASLTLILARITCSRAPQTIDALCNVLVHRKLAHTHLLYSARSSDTAAVRGQPPLSVALLSMLHSYAMGARRGGASGNGHGGNGEFERFEVHLPSAGGASWWASTNVLVTLVCALSAVPHSEERVDSVRFWTQVVHTHDHFDAHGVRRI